MKQARQWTPQELADMQNLYPVIGPKKLSAKLRIGYSLIKHKAVAMGLKVSFRWLPADIEYLRKNYNTASPQEQELRLGRQFAYISRKASMLGIANRWGHNCRPKGPRGPNKRTTTKPTVITKTITKTITVSRQAPKTEQAKKQQQKLQSRQQIPQVPLRINHKTVIMVPATYTEEQKQKVIKTYTR